MVEDTNPTLSFPFPLFYVASTWPITSPSNRKVIQFTRHHSLLKYTEHLAQETIHSLTCSLYKSMLSDYAMVVTATDVIPAFTGFAVHGT